MNNYTLLEEKYIEEIDSNVKLYSHNKTKARVVTIENDDDNKVFSIGFRTPPINSCGLTHILEHSVLCGSRKYPVKDPFVELLKSSLNTFLNAFTYPDKTMYPVASKNLKDFNKLIDVYMDAVFYPNIYKYKEIFMQEGWHYHILDKKDPITYNGVVYNEMKGAFSNPQSVLGRVIMHTLYKDMAYGLESGGDPKYIPDLTYEEFINFHKKYYHPSNSYIYFYGNCNMESELEYIDKNYLSCFEYDSFDTRLKLQKPFEKPKYETYYYESDSIENKTFLSYNLVYPFDTPLKDIIATNIILASVFEATGAKIPERMVNEQVGFNIEAYLDDGLFMPMLSITAMNTNPDKEEKFINIINEELLDIIKNGIDKKSILSLIKYGEFKARESLISPRFPKGLGIIVNSMSSFLYDDKKAFDRLEIIKYYAELKNDLENGYFEEIINKYILNNNHKAFVKLVPKLNYSADERKEVEERLKKFKDSLSDKELDDLVLMNQKLREYQSEASKPEDIDKLPKLTIDDISDMPENINLEIIDEKYKLLFSDYHTNGIYYISNYYDISDINIDDLKYVSLFTDLVTELDTKKYKYKDLNELIQAETGGISISLVTYKTEDKKSLIKINTSLSCLKDNINLAYDLLNEMMFNTSFSNEKRLFEKLKEIKNSIDMSFVSKGHIVANRKALSLIDKNAYEEENISGISYADFITNLINDYDNKKSYIIDKLNNVKKLFSKKNAIFSFTGTKDMLDIIKNNIDNHYNNLYDNLSYVKYEFKKEHYNQAFKASFDVNYNALVGSNNLEYNAGLLVLVNAINTDYLWLRVRVHGGAYGVFLRANDENICFASYRDPNILKTYDAYKEVIDYIDSFNPTEEELLKYKIGTIGNSQLVLHNKDLAAFGRSLYFRGLSYELRCKRRKEVLDLKVSDIKGFKKYFVEALKDSIICTVGSKDKVEENKKLYDKIENLEK